MSIKFGKNGISRKTSIGLDLGKYGYGFSSKHTFFDLFGGDPELAGVNYEAFKKNNHDGSSEGGGFDLGIFNGGYYGFKSQKEGMFDARYEAGARLPKYLSGLIIVSVAALVYFFPAIFPVLAAAAKTIPGLLAKKGLATSFGTMLALFGMKNVEGSETDGKK